VPPGQARIEQPRLRFGELREGLRGPAADDVRDEPDPEKRERAVVALGHAVSSSQVPQAAFDLGRSGIGAVALDQDPCQPQVLPVAECVARQLAGVERAHELGVCLRPSGGHAAWERRSIGS
jgi:hypothetical protein